MYFNTLLPSPRIAVPLPVGLFRRTSYTVVIGLPVLPHPTVHPLTTVSRVLMVRIRLHLRTLPYGVQFPLTLNEKPSLERWDTRR